MKYLGFRIEPTMEFFVRWWAGRRGGKSPIVLYARSQRALKKYIRAIHAAERTGTIR